ncbi:EamA family transporter [Pendulispora brunnea]|uniref:EamA family transporter n=1 Tax=Pendulispora brunnea TaxID=2905690 RepID=A0ABZ2KA16_9BACT
MEIVLLTLACAVFYSIFAIFAGLAGGKIDDWLASVFYNGVGTVVPLIVYWASSDRGKTTWRGALLAGVAGVGIMLFSVVLARIYTRGGNLSFVVPALYGGAIVLSSLFGWLVLKERVSSLQAAGLAFIVAGIACIVVAKLQKV